MLCLLFPLIVFALGLAGYWMGGRVRRWTGSFGSMSVTQNVALTRDRSEAYRVKPGPWGDLECVPIFIEIPDEYLAIRVHEADVPRWFFANYSPTGVSNLFESVALSHEAKQELLDAGKWEATSTGVFVRPPPATVQALDPDARAKIYSILSKSDSNPAQSQAYSWTEESANQFFESADIAPATRDLVKKLSYRRGKLVVFSDLPVVLQSLTDEVEKRRLEKALSRRPTLLVRFILNPETDVAGLVKYWGRAGFGKDIEPILQAAARVPGGTKLSILNVLPPEPTAHLYTFPFPTAGAEFDCHWTSFNFFKNNPDPPTNDGSFWKHKLDTEYYPVATDPRYGDIAMLVRPNGVIIHSCVYLADDIVYTKNGANSTVPWTLMRIPDLLEAYAPEAADGETLRVEYYRNKSY